MPAISVPIVSFAAYYANSLIIKTPVPILLTAVSVFDDDIPCRVRFTSAIFCIRTGSSLVLFTGFKALGVQPEKLTD